MIMYACVLYTACDDRSLFPVDSCSEVCDQLSAIPVVRRSRTSTMAMAAMAATAAMGQVIRYPGNRKLMVNIG